MPLFAEILVQGNSQAPYSSNTPPFPPLGLPINDLAPVALAPHISGLNPNPEDEVTEVTMASLPLFDNCDYLALSEGMAGAMTWNFDALDNFEKTFGPYVPQ
jgi:hypothetical protein